MYQVSLIGHGNWGKKIEQALNNNPNFTVTNIYTSKNINTLTYTDCDIVAVFTPISSHYIHVKNALLAGKHVLVAKPIAETYSQAKELIDLAKSKNLVLFCDYTWLYNEHCINLSAPIQSVATTPYNQEDFLLQFVPHDLSLMYKAGLEPKHWSITPSSYAITCNDGSQFILSQSQSKLRLINGVDCYSTKTNALDIMSEEFFQSINQGHLLASTLINSYVSFWLYKLSVYV